AAGRSPRRPAPRPRPAPPRVPRRWPPHTQAARRPSAAATDWWWRPAAGTGRSRRCRPCRRPRWTAGAAVRAGSASRCSRKKRTPLSHPGASTCGGAASTASATQDLGSFPTGSKKTRIRRGAPTRHSMVARCIRGKSWDNAGAWGAVRVSSRRDQAQEQTRSQQTTWGKSHTANMARPHPGSYAGAWQATGTPMADTELRIALLIDADNAPASRIEPILTELRSEEHTSELQSRENIVY